MSPDADPTLGRALEALKSGAVRPPDDVPSDVWTFARALVAARRGDLEEESCPARARRRAHALFDARRAPLAERLARLAFDSWARAAPATRGRETQRMLRFENGPAALDVELSWPDAGRAEAHVAVEGAGPLPWVRYEVPGEDVSEVWPLDDHDAARLPLPAQDGVVLVVGDEDGELLRTPPLALA